MKHQVSRWKTGFRRNFVIRQVRDRDGNVLDYLAEPHCGSIESITAAAQRLSDRMFLLFDDASNIESPILATDGDAVPRWSISPNFRIIEQL